MTTANRIKGVLSPVVTPFKADLSPDKDRFVTHCKWLMSHNCGLAVFGTNSEANSLAADERMTMLDAVVAAGVNTARMMPGTGCSSITETVKLTSHAVRHGCAGVLMLPPFYYKGVSDDGLYRHYSEVVQRVGDAVKDLLYHIPPVAVVGITPGLVERLPKLTRDAIAGTKDSSGDWNNTKIFLDTFAKRLRRVRRLGIIPARHHENGGVDDLRYRQRQSAQFTAYSEWQNADAEQQQQRPNLVRDTIGKKYVMISALKQTIAIYADDPACRCARRWSSHRRSG
jgi:4-hydroxy-tetrahydrodipicolinate synthase